VWLLFMYRISQLVLFLFVLRRIMKHEDLGIVEERDGLIV
jgi:hypothetical protein